MFNKFIKIILLNILVIVIIFVFAEFISFWKILKYYEKNKHYSFNYSLKIDTFDSFYNYFKKNYIRPVENKNIDAAPVIIFGCSFAYGDNLNDNQTFSHKLAKYIKRPIYNMAYGGWSVANMLYQIENDNLIKSIRPPKYVIFVYCPYQQHRIYLHIFDPGETRLCVHYNKLLNSNILKQQKVPTFLFSLYTIKTIDNFIAHLKGYNHHFEKSRNHLTILFYKQSIDLMKKYWNNNYTQYFILNYSNTTQPFLETLQKETDWEIINLYDLDNCNNIFNNVKFQISEQDIHPNEKAWDIIAPAFANQIQNY